MIYLYDSTETDFRYNGKPLPTAYDVTVSNTLNNEYYVMGKYPLDKDKVYKEIVEDRIIKVHTMDGMQPFRIVNVSKQELYVEFEAWPLFYADMRNKLVKPLNLKRASGQTALNSFKNNLLIDTPFDFYSDITDNHDYYTQDENERENNPKQLYNALDVFKTIVNRWGGELWIRGYDIRVNKRIGTDTEAMLYEKKNITEFVDTTNIEGIVTRLHGKSEWQDERKEGEEEGQKHSIEVTVDSPLINNYSGVVFEKQFTNNDIRTERELRNWLNLKFTTENIDKPQRTIEVGTNIIDDTKIGFADTLILKYIKHDTDVRIKVVGYEYDGFANELKHVVLGQPKHTSSSTIGNTITDLVNNVVEPVDKKTTIAMNTADGKSTVFHGTADPNTLNLNAKENDTYFRTNGSEKEIWRFTGTLWELIMDTSDTTKNAREIEAVIEQAEADKQALETEINQTYEDAVTEADRLAAIRDNGITIEAGQIIAGTIDTARLDAVSIVTSGLSANVIKANHIQADNALFDKLFTSTLATDRLSAQTAWIKNGMFANASIDGAKIQNATIGSAKIASLDAGKITTGELRGIRVIAKVGEIGDWNLDSGVLYSQIRSGENTSIKATGVVAFAAGAPNPRNTEDANLQIYHDGRLNHLKNGIVRKSLKDEYIRFYAPNGDHKGTIESGGNFQITAHNGELHLYAVNSEIYARSSLRPYVNGGINLGGVNYRWTRTYVTQSESVSSDARFKSDIQALPKDLIKYIAKYVKPKQYTMYGKTHYGYVAQDVRQALREYARTKVAEKEVNDYVKRFDFLQEDESLALTYAEIAVIKDEEQNLRIKELENRIEELENAS